eukprot:scaffold13753_cov65-Cyclotella_meneghiniana.AAC.2
MTSGDASFPTPEMPVLDIKEEDDDNKMNSPQSAGTLNKGGHVPTNASRSQFCSEVEELKLTNETTQLIKQ